MHYRNDGKALEDLVDLDGRRTLDIGCGRGELLRFMRRKGAHPTGIECNPLQLAAAAEQPGMAGAEIVEGVGQDLPFEDDRFDLTVFMYSLHHVPVDVQDAALAEARRVLKPGGMLYVAEPLCEGSGFLVHKPVDDETAVRAAALSALKRAEPLFAEAEEIRYDTSYHYDSFETFKADMVRIGPERAADFESKETMLRELYGELGVEEPEGMRFDQPVRVNMLRK